VEANMKLGWVAIGLLLCLMALPMVAQSASAWGPNTHVWLVNEALTQAGGTSITDVINRNIDAYYAGLMFPDVSVFYYYTDWESYQSTHSWSFYQKLLQAASTEDELAFAYGVGTHMVQDSISHNYFVPRKIRESGIMNAVIHPPVEAVVDSHLQMPQTPGTMAAIDSYLPLTEEVLGRDFTTEAHLLRDILAGGSFYNSAFAPPEEGWAYKFYRAAFAAIAALNPEDDSGPERNLAIQYTVSFCKTGATPPLDPTGSPSLASADAASQWLVWTLRLVAVSLFIAVLWRSGVLAKIRGRLPV